MLKRKLAIHDNLKITIEQAGDAFHVQESSILRTLEVDFNLGVNFEYSLADGTELSVSSEVAFSIVTCCIDSETDSSGKDLMVKLKSFSMLIKIL